MDYVTRLERIGRFAPAFSSEQANVERLRQFLVLGESVTAQDEQGKKA
jgi:hypothetical protein